MKIQTVLTRVQWKGQVPFKWLTFPSVEVDVEQWRFSNAARKCINLCHSCGEQLGGICEVGDAKNKHEGTHFIVNIQPFRKKNQHHLYFL